MENKYSQSNNCRAVGVLGHNDAVRAVGGDRRAQVAPDLHSVRELRQSPRRGQRAARVRSAQFDGVLDRRIRRVLEAGADADAAVGEAHESARSPVASGRWKPLHFGERAVYQSVDAHTVVRERGHEALFAGTLETADVLNIIGQTVCL